jgi:hypothetical protein
MSNEQSHNSQDMGFSGENSEPRQMGNSPHLQGQNQSPQGAQGYGMPNHPHQQPQGQNQSPYGAQGYGNPNHSHQQPQGTQSPPYYYGNTPQNAYQNQPYPTQGYGIEPNGGGYHNGQSYNSHNSPNWPNQAPNYDPRMGQYPQQYAANQPPNNGLSSFFNFRDERFLKGALVGAAATFLLTNGNVQKNAINSIVKVWSMFQGGLEEVKERFRDAEAEIKSKETQ